MENKNNFTPRELDIIEYMSQGLNNAEIAKKLFISIHTVKSHLESMYEKIGINNRVQLIVYSFQNGILKWFRRIFCFSIHLVRIADTHQGNRVNIYTPPQNHIF